MKLFRLFLWIINQNIYSQNCFIVFAAPVRVFLWINNNANRPVTRAEPICSFILLIDEAATGFNVARLTSSQSSRKGEQEILSLRPLLPEQQMQPLPLLPRPGWRRRPCSVVAPTPPSPPLWAGSAANAPPGRICCINSGPGIPAERGFTERGLCEVVWTEEGLRDAFCCSRQPRCGVFSGCGGRGVWSVSVMSRATDVLMFYQRWERTECTSTERRAPPQHPAHSRTTVPDSGLPFNSAGRK